MRITSNFEDDIGDVLVAEAVKHLMADGGPVEKAIEQSHAVLRGYGEFNDYHVESIIESHQEPEVDVRGDGFQIRWGWEHEAAPYFEWGVPEHTIDGDPILSFVWEDPPQWVTEEFDAEGDGYRVFFGSVEHPGLPEARFARSALDFLRQEVS